MCHLVVLLPKCNSCIAFVALDAHIFPDIGMDIEMRAQIWSISECPQTVWTIVRPFAGVYAKMIFQWPSPWEHLPTEVTSEGHFVCVAAKVLPQWVHRSINSATNFATVHRWLLCGKMIFCFQFTDQWYAFEVALNCTIGFRGWYNVQWFFF